MKYLNVEIKIKTFLINQMSDDRVVMISANGYQGLVNPAEGKGLHWSTDVHDELPVKMRPSGVGSEVPFTLT